MCLEKKRDYLDHSVDWGKVFGPPIHGFFLVIEKIIRTVGGVMIFILIVDFLSHRSNIRAACQAPFGLSTFSGYGIRSLQESKGKQHISDNIEVIERAMDIGMLVTCCRHKKWRIQACCLILIVHNLSSWYEAWREPYFWSTLWGPIKT